MRACLLRAGSGRRRVRSRRVRPVCRRRLWCAFHPAFPRRSSQRRWPPPRLASRQVTVAGPRAATELIVVVGARGGDRGERDVSRSSAGLSPRGRGRVAPGRVGRRARDCSTVSGHVASARSGGRRRPVLQSLGPLAVASDPS